MALDADAAHRPVEGIATLGAGGICEVPGLS
jgi:hypothetical protein